jgi:hypothetical protein
VRSCAASVLLTILRIAAGLALMLAASPFLIRGGLSRYAKYGTPAHTDWRYLAVAFLLLGAGSFLVRPYWWKHLGRR